MSQDRDECDDMVTWSVRLGLRRMCARRRTGELSRDARASGVRRGGAERAVCVSHNPQATGRPAARADFYIRDTALRASQLVLYAYS